MAPKPKGAQKLTVKKAVVAPVPPKKSAPPTSQKQPPQRDNHAKASTKIQCMYRCHVARRSVAEKRNAVEAVRETEVKGETAVTISPQPLEDNDAHPTQRMSPNMVKRGPPRFIRKKKELSGNQSVKEKEKSSPSDDHREIPVVAPPSDDPQLSSAEKKELDDGFKANPKAMKLMSGLQFKAKKKKPEPRAHGEATTRKSIWVELKVKLPTARTIEAKAVRKKMFSQFDPNGNGFLSLAEVDAGSRKELQLEQLTDDLAPILMRAFTAAKDSRKAKGKNKKHGDDYVEKSEFRLLFVYIKRYFELWFMFDEIDTSDDRRVNLDEFKTCVSEIESWGVRISDPEASFKEIDTNGGGIILFNEFSEWAIAKGLDLEEGESDDEDEAGGKRASNKLTGEQLGRIGAAAAANNSVAAKRRSSKPALKKQTTTVVALNSSSRSSSVHAAVSNGSVKVLTGTESFLVSHEESRKPSLSESKERAVLPSSKTAPTGDSSSSKFSAGGDIKTTPLGTSVVAPPPDLLSATAKSNASFVSEDILAASRVESPPDGFHPEMSAHFTPRKNPAQPMKNQSVMHLVESDRERRKALLAMLREENAEAAAASVSESEGDEMSNPSSKAMERTKLLAERKKTMGKPKKELPEFAEDAEALDIFEAKLKARRAEQADLDRRREITARISELDNVAKQQSERTERIKTENAELLTKLEKLEVKQLAREKEEMQRAQRAQKIKNVNTRAVILGERNVLDVIAEKEKHDGDIERKRIENILEERRAQHKIWNHNLVSSAGGDDEGKGGSRQPSSTYARVRAEMKENAHAKKDTVAYQRRQQAMAYASETKSGKQSTPRRLEPLGGGDDRGDEPPTKVDDEGKAAPQTQKPMTTKIPAPPAKKATKNLVKKHSASSSSSRGALAKGGEGEVLPPKTPTPPPPRIPTPPSVEEETSSVVVTVKKGRSIPAVIPEAPSVAPGGKKKKVTSPKSEVKNNAAGAKEVTTSNTEVVKGETESLGDFTPRKKKEGAEPAMDGFDEDPNTIPRGARPDESDSDDEERDTHALGEEDGGVDGRGGFDIVEGDASPEQIQGAQDAEVVAVEYDETPENTEAATRIQCAFRQQQARAVAQGKREAKRSAFNDEVATSLFAAKRLEAKDAEAEVIEGTEAPVVQGELDGAE